MISNYSLFLANIWGNLMYILSQPMQFLPYTWGQFVLAIMVANIVIGIVRWVLGIGVDVELSGHFRDQRTERKANSKKVKVAEARKGDTH